MNTPRYEVEEEIKEISPGISEMLKQRRIKGIPEGYFETNENLLTALALLSVKKEHKYDDIPAGYFGKTENKVISKSVHKKNWVQPMYWMAAASMVMLLTALVFWPTTEDINTDENEMVWLYLEEQSHTLDLDDLVNAGLITEESFSEDEFPEDILYDSIDLSDWEDDL